MTRKDFEGAETGLRFGAATQGGNNQFTGSQLLGSSWNTGNALLSYEYNDQRGLDAADRHFIPDQNGTYSLIPRNKRNSVILSAAQSAGDESVISADFTYSNRDFSIINTQYGQLLNQRNEYRSGGRSEQSGLAVNLRRSLFGDWQGDPTGTYSPPS